MEEFDDVLDNDGKKHKINSKDRILVYLAALELMGWKLQHESRFYEKKSTLAHLIHQEIVKCRAFLRKTEEFKDSPDNVISTKAYIHLLHIKNRNITPKPEFYQNSIWKSDHEDYHKLWPKVEKYPRDFDITKARRQAEVKGTKRKPGE